MKKIFCTLLLGGFIMAGLSAKTAFVYFSATGTTERMAKNAASRCKGASVSKRSVYTKLWSVVKSGSSTLATYFLLFITSAIAEVTK